MNAQDGSNALIKWFWTEGIKRQGRYALGTGTWLDTLYNLELSAQLTDAALANPRPCIAVWGPSQAGKSTLLSKYFDGANHQLPAAGFASALQWSVEEPVVFVGRENTPANCVQLNPYNRGSDASGCVSRFELKSSVDDPKHPIRLTLATESQILHALAAGFLSECDDSDSPTGSTYLDIAGLESLLQRYESAAAPPSPPNQAAYQRLREVADILDDLVHAEWPRYANLRGQWSSLRTRLLSHASLLSSTSTVDDFAFHVFWNGESKLSELFQALCKKRQQIQQRFENRAIYCSARAARLFLNIDSYKDADAVNPSAANLDVRFAINSDRVTLDYDSPEKLFVDKIDFGYWQGLVWQLTFPINEKVLAATSPEAVNFLKAADVIDFPGVALEMVGGHRLSATQMSSDDLLKKVLKRGKTASIVSQRARALGIDSFCLLCRMGTPPAQPSQLIHGIKSWLQSLQLSLPPRPYEAAPLNIVLTFAANFVNHELAAPNPANFTNLFDWLKRLGPLTEPGWPTYFATTYPHLPTGRIDTCTDAQINAIYQRVNTDQAFTDRFGSDSESIRHMFLGGLKAEGDGGVGFLIQSLTRQVQQTRSSQLLAQRQQYNADMLTTLLNEALPPDDNERRKVDLANWVSAINNCSQSFRSSDPQADAAMKVSLLLRKLLNVDADLLETVPLQCANVDITTYVGRQFNSRWLQDRCKHANGWAVIGLTDQTTTVRLLSYLCDHALRDGAVAHWIRQHLGQLNNHDEARHARRFLATKMGDSLCFDDNREDKHRQFANAGAADNIEARLEAYFAIEKLAGENRKAEDSPHYRGFIAPFLNHLTRIAESPSGERPNLVGDEALRQLRLQLTQPTGAI